MSHPLPPNIQKILQLLPHRYPFLLVDRVIEFNPGKYIKAYKNVSINEPFFQGHFPGFPVMPGVLILEAMAQSGGITILQSFPINELQGKVFLFAGIENVKFRQQVIPGDQLILECEIIRHKLQLWKMSCQAFVNNKLVAEAILTAAMTNKESF